MSDDLAVETILIDGNRLLSDLAELSTIGKTPEGGVNRPALSAADLQARQWFQSRIEQAGLIFKQDKVGNLSGIFLSENLAAKTILFGSHLDSVPMGGKYDGALGVVSAIEVLRTVKEAKLKLKYHLEAINFTDEEGAWRGEFGSKGLTGQLNEDDFNKPRGKPEEFHTSLLQAGITNFLPSAAKRSPSTLKAWVEAHIEQRSSLEEKQIHIGIVRKIIGIANYRLTYYGRADHSGTTDFGRRHNALRGVARFVLECQELVQTNFPGGRVNCSMVEVLPDAINIIPAIGRVAFEIRHIEEPIIEEISQALLSLAKAIAKGEKLGLEFQELDYHPPATLDRSVGSAIEIACNRLHVQFMNLNSYAGHDSQIMSTFIPSGMFFVPSIGGASHCPQELTTDEDCILAGNVLLHTVLELAK